MALYEDDEMVGRLTAEAMAKAGTDVFQIFKLGDDDFHAARLLQLFDPPEGARVIDVGCGVGGMSRRMASLRPDLSWTLLNISAYQLGHCPDSMARVHAAFEDAPLADGSADAIMLAYVLGHLDLKRAMASAARLLTFGGVLFIWDMSAFDDADKERVKTTLDYTLHRVADVWQAAIDVGLRLTDLSNDFIATTADFARLVPAGELELLLDGVTPQLYRFIRC